MENWEIVAREQVRDTVAAYNHSGDRFLLEELAACFTEDGVLESKGDWVARGRKEIIATLSGVRATEAVPGQEGAVEARRPSFVRHFLTNLRFDAVSPERIQTSAYFAVLTAAGLDHWGRYRDVLVPAEGRWLIAHRVVRTDAMVPDSPFQRG
ncbi:nuclear transport factor 2 family protein [Frankia sp. CNm7]|uniref:Nuclear transport factor 2 family protein n=1 Tax=Frankia nepalensis TaxID=1836974 RepID=A0A937RQJ4_9ACTN|nr:nuclear transport factor 2 family protein [Frankia nepalensis]MBL7497847.1 nuclear transport factor 2 family protein [Frankia nepalensis]MBL7509670.1 nuclear transport factor 2 family protein [Frankia nepalensis]MBL7520965.1 nuclear transport factor 2 family protein [Frankia nepalensis]MBL7630833.1 nuclear transport factor 2 family protein [Frankia nepalensis]